MTSTQTEHEGLIAGTQVRAGERAEIPAPPARQTRHQSMSHRALRRFTHHRLAVLGAAVLLLLIVMAVLAPIIGGQNPYYQDYSAIKAPPDSGHILGTDALGRDVWARIVFATRISLSVGLVAVSISTLIGTILGAIAGFYGGLVDSVIMRITDVVMSFPLLIIIITVVALIGPSLFNIMTVIGLIAWPSICRLVRGQFLSLREQEFVTAAECLGVPSWRIIFSHLLPNCVGAITVAATFGMAGAILTEASLSFLGLGVPPPEPSWGQMLTEAQKLSILADMPWLWIPPGVMIALTVLAVNFVGDGLRDALDPQSRLG